MLMPRSAPHQGSALLSRLGEISVLPLQDVRADKRQHGNRSPLADPRMRGMIMGLTLDDGISDLAAKFNVTLEVGALGASSAAVFRDERV